MKKHKIKMAKYADMHTETEVVGNDDVKIVVRDHIPYAQKEEMALEIAGRSLIIHDDSCVYLSSQYGKIEKYYIAKYYTDINTDGAEMDEVSDFLINGGFIDNINEIIWSDLQIVHEIFDLIEESFTTSYADDKGLTKAVRKSFGFLFNGEDITDSLAKAEMTRDTLYKALDALNAKEKESSEQMDNGRLTIEGNIINFAKRE